MADINYAELLSAQDQQALLEGRLQDLSVPALRLLTGKGFDTGDVVARGLERGVTDSARGIAQMAGYGDIYPGDAEKERELRMMMETNPVAAYGSNIAGNALDPVTLPVAFLKPLKAASTVGTMALRGAAQGGFGGAIGSVYDEYGDSRLLNTAAGTVLGAGLGAVLGKVLKKLGIDLNAEDAAAKLKNLTEEEKALIRQADAEDKAAEAKTQEEPAPTARAEEPQAAAPITREPLPFEKRMSPENQQALTSGVLDDTQLTLVNKKLTEAQASIAKAEERLYDIQNTQRQEKQTPALFKGAPEAETPKGMGLISPSAPSRGSQVAALFKAAPKAEQEPIREAVKQEAKLTSQQDYLQKLIEEKQNEVIRYQDLLDRHEQAKAKQATARPQEAPQAPKASDPAPNIPEAVQAAPEASNAVPEGFPKQQVSMGAAGTRPAAVYGPDLAPEMSKMSNEDILTSSALGVDLADVEARAGLVSGSLKNIARRGATLRKQVLKEDYNDLLEWMVDPKNQNRPLNDAETIMIKPIVEDAMAKRMKLLDDIQEYVANNDDLDTKEAAQMVEDLLYYSGIDAFYKRTGTLASRAFNARKLIQMKLSKNQPISSIFPTVSC